MGFFVCLSEIERGTIVAFVFIIYWGIQWLYRYLTASDGATSNEDEVEDKDTPPITTIPITSKVGHKTPQPTPCPQIVTANPRPSPLAASVIEARKTSLGNKRKLFRNILLVDAFMQRKDFIT